MWRVATAMGVKDFLSTGPSEDGSCADGSDLALLFKDIVFICRDSFVVSCISLSISLERSLERWRETKEPRVAKFSKERIGD